MTCESAAAGRGRFQCALPSLLKYLESVSIASNSFAVFGQFSAVNQSPTTFENANGVSVASSLARLQSSAERVGEEQMPAAAVARGEALPVAFGLAGVVIQARGVDLVAVNGRIFRVILLHARIAILTAVGHILHHGHHERRRPQPRGVERRR